MLGMQGQSVKISEAGWVDSIEGLALPRRACTQSRYDRGQHKTGHNHLNTACQIRSFTNGDGSFDDSADDGRRSARVTQTHAPSCGACLAPAVRSPASAGALDGKASNSKIVGLSHRHMQPFQVGGTPWSGWSSE
jgi:hypothetical protein